MTALAKAAQKIRRNLNNQFGADCIALMFHVPDINTWQCARCGTACWVQKTPAAIQ